MPTAFGLLLAGAAFAFAETYEAPARIDRLFPGVPASVATVGFMIAVNAGVLVAWRIPMLWRTLNKYMLVVPAYPYTFSVFGNTISHQGFLHFAGNMAGFVLWGIPREPSDNRALENTRH